MLLRALAVSAVAVGAVVGAPVAFDTAAPLTAAAVLAPTTFTIDAAHSQLQFKVRHLGVSTVIGKFGTFSGTFTLDPATGAASAASLSVDVASVSTGVERRDNHLKSPDFFAADSFPKITFTSTNITKTGNGTYKVMGNLTMRGVTKPVTLDAELGGARQTADGWIAGVSMTGKIKRKEFGLMWDRITEGVAVVSDDVTLDIGIEAKAGK